MNRSASFLALAILAGIVSAQTAPPPAFEAASVKPSHLGGFGNVMEDASRISYPGCPLKYLIRRAWGITDAQISGPAWLDAQPGDPTGRFDLVATLPATAPKDRARLIRLMLQTFLTEQFKLEVHHEQKTMSAYELVVGKDGPKMQQAASGDPANEFCADAFVAGGPNDYQCHLKMADLPPILMNEIMQEGVPVIDRTGLTSVYDFRLAWYNRAEIRMGRASGPDIYSAVEELGLKLQSTKAPVDVLVIDRAEKQPTAN